jgi:serine/threonine protein kinase
LKDSTLSLVKIADFGLSDFYRPGATMKSSCGTLSFLAPEVFKGTSNAGEPLFAHADLSNYQPLDNSHPAPCFPC